MFIVDNKLGLKIHVVTMSRKKSSAIGAIERVELFLTDFVVKI